MVVSQAYAIKVKGIGATAAFQQVPVGKRPESGAKL